MSVGAWFTGCVVLPGCGGPKVLKLGGGLGWWSWVVGLGGGSKKWDWEEGLIGGSKKWDWEWACVRCSRFDGLVSTGCCRTKALKRVAR